MMTLHLEDSGCYKASQSDEIHSRKISNADRHKMRRYLSLYIVMSFIFNL